MRPVPRDTPGAQAAFGVFEKDGESILNVRDHGGGFSMDYAGEFFRALQRLHRPDEFAGRGVGLAIVERIVQKHGGRVWAEGEVERGAAFYFTLA